MKKFITLLLLSGLFASSYAQPPAPCNAQFVFAVNGNTVSFLPAVLGDTATTRHLWYFGDGTSSDRRDPSHTYAQCGTYTVKHVFKTIGSNTTQLCSDSVTAVVILNCAPACNLQAYFTYTIAAGANNTSLVSFTNATAGFAPGDSIRWTFGDGTTSNLANPQHTYPANGTYTVCLRIKKPTTSASAIPCVSEFCKLIVISNVSACNIAPSFAKAPSPATPLRILFVNTTPVLTSSIATALWTFGDGTSASTWNAEHTYPAPGRYRACLRVTYGNCTRETCDSIIVEQPRTINCDSVRVNFLARREPTLPNRVWFVTQSNVPVTQETWTITPLSSSITTGVVTLNQINPIYQFTQPGAYRVCLRATTLGNCIKEKCDTVTVGATPNLCMLTAFPNPAQSQVSVYVTLTQPRLINAYLYNGQLVQVGSVSQWGNTGNNLITFNIGALPSGFYTIKILYGDRICYTRFSKQ